MAVIRWIMSNMLWVFLAAVVVVGYVYWDALRPHMEDLGIVVDDPVTAEAAPQASAPAPTVAAPMQTSPMAQQPSRPLTARPYAPQPRPAAPVLAADLKDAWAEARKAYWAKDLDKALTLYAALSKAHPDQADVLGEWGNVLLQKGDRALAAEKYAAAGALMVEAGRLDAAAKALRPLAMLDVDKARALQTALQAAQQKN